MTARKNTPKSKALTTVSHGEMTLGAFHLTATGLAVKGKPSFGEWQECGGTLQRMEGAIQFWIGDWLNFGEHAYGEKYAQAVNETQAETWTNYAWVARQVEISTRVENLSWTHHREVASFARDIQADLLAAAVSGEWTHRELADDINWG